MYGGWARDYRFGVGANGGKWIWLGERLLVRRWGKWKIENGKWKIVIKYFPNGLTPHPHS